MTLLTRPGADRGGVDGGGAGSRHVSPPYARGQHAGVRLVRGRQLHDRLFLPHRAHRRVHGVRCAHPEDPRGLQREQAHRSVWLHPCTYEYLLVRIFSFQRFRQKRRRVSIEPLRNRYKRKIEEDINDTNRCRASGRLAPATPARSTR